MATAVCIRDHAHDVPTLTRSHDPGHGVATTITYRDAFFVGVALVADLAASYRARLWCQGLIAAIWALLIGTVLWSGAVLLID